MNEKIRSICNLDITDEEKIKRIRILINWTVTKQQLNDSEEIVEYYYKKAKNIAAKYRNISNSKKFIQKALLEETKENIIKSINNYYNASESWYYMVAADKFFNLNSIKWQYYKDFINIEEVKLDEYYVCPYGNKHKKNWKICTCWY